MLGGEYCGEGGDVGRQRKMGRLRVARLRRQADGWRGQCQDGEENVGEIVLWGESVV